MCIIGGLLVGGIFLSRVDFLGTERFSMWKEALSDAKMKPISGWGLDSFRHITKEKPFTYYKRISGDTSIERSYSQCCY
jgi:O-antigen ligase